MIRKTYFLMVLLALAACTKENNELQIIETNVGENFSIELEANWSAGYAWKWMNHQSCIVADSINHEYIQGNSGLEGSPGREIWHFTSLRTGTETLSFGYYHATSPDRPEKEKFVRLSVR